MDDPTWIRAALERFESPLILHARRHVGDLERARDVVQETFLRLCRTPRERVEPRLAGWLFEVCRNVALDVRRKDGGGPVANQVEAPEPTSPERDPAAQAAGREVGAHVLRALAGLPEKQREVLELRFAGGLSYKEIGQATGHSLGNVGYLIHAGLCALRTRLSGDELEEVQA